MAHDVFVSYSHHDRAQADAVCATLEAKGIRCWIAPRDVVPGQEWGAAIVEAIRSSRVMVLVFSSHANASPQIRREVERAVSAGSVLIPFRIEDVAPAEALEYFLGAPHWLDALTPPMEVHLARLARAAASFLVTVGEPGGLGAGTRLGATDTDHKVDGSMTSRTSDTPVASLAKTKPASSTKPPLLQRLSRRTKVALILGAVAVVAIAAVVLVTSLTRGSERTGSPSSTAAPPSQEVLPFTDLKDPDGVAVDAEGTVYVTDAGGNRVLALAGGSGTLTVLPFIGLNHPRGVAVDSAGTLYVIDSGNDRVLRLPAGSGAPTTLPFIGLNHPRGVAVDNAGTLYVTDANNNRVLRLPTGAGAATLPFMGLNHPRGVAVDSSGALYVTDANNNRVLRLPAGSSSPTAMPFTGLNHPDGVAVDAAGALYITDANNNRVLWLAAGAGTPTVRPFIGLKYPVGVAVDSSNSLYITDADNNRVLKLPAA